MVGRDLVLTSKGQKYFMIMETTIGIGLDIIALLIFDFLRENRWFSPFSVHNEAF